MSIPKIIHQYWTGSPVPQDDAERSVRLEEMNPGWQMCRWTDGTIGTLVNQDRFDQAEWFSHPDRFPVFRSNLVRAELLLTFGGMWVDYDWEPMRPFDELPDADYYVGHNGQNPDLTVIGCTPGHPLAYRLVAALGALPPSRYRRNAGCHALRAVLEQQDFDIMPFGAVYAYTPTAETFGTTIIT